jgi:hypothetical protein
MESGSIFVVAGGEAAKLFESREAAFDAVALFIQVLIVVSMLLAIGLGGNDGLGSCGLDVFEDGVGVVAFVGQYRLRFPGSQQRDGLRAVGHLSAGQRKIKGSPRWLHKR